MPHYNVRENNHNWNGGKTSDSRGRILLLNKNHPRHTHEGYVFEHILVAEKALGKFITKDHPIHHVNGIQSDNRPCNLVVCENSAYHMLLHRRQKAKEACDNKKFVPCRECKQYFDSDGMTLHSRKKNQNIYICKPCNRNRSKQWNEKYPEYWKKFYNKKGGDSHSAP